MVVSRTSVTYHGGLTSLRQPRSGTGTLEESGYRWMGAPGGSETVRTKVVTEAGLKVDGSEFAQNVFAILNDPRGWQRNFQTVTEDEDLLVILASPDTVDSLCAPLDTRGYTSCRRGDKAIINVERWAIGAETFLDAGGTVQEYRNYLINHEVGHVLGYDHVRCEPGDELAPVMLQQTLTLGGCKPNGWPNPDGRAQG